MSTTTIEPNDADVRRNVGVLAVAQALGGSAPSIVISVAGLAGAMIATDKALATVPVSMMQLGLAVWTLPVAWLARTRGRKPTSMLGAAVGIVSGVLAAAMIQRGSFWGLCLATFLLGFYFTTVQQYRFAAADMASQAMKARAISWVMLGGVAAGVIGPQTTILTRDLLAPVPFAGAFLGQAALAVLSLGVLTLLGRRDMVSTVGAPAGPRRPTAELIRQPRLIAAIVCGLISYGLMSFVMTAAPLAMVGCGLPMESAWWGIQWHVLAMYLPAFWTGRLIDRFGKEKITATGLVLLAISAVVALSGLEIAHFWSSLVLLGVGWNFAFVGSTALVTDCYRPSERATVQSINDFSVFGTVAIASFASGQILNAGGWGIVNWIVFPATAFALAALWIARPRPAAATA